MTDVPSLVAANAGDARKGWQVTTLRQVARSVLLTAAVAAVLIGWPVLAWSRYREINRSNFGYQFDVVDTMLAVSALILVGLLLAIVSSFRPLRHRQSIRELQTGFRTVIAESYLGQGHYHRWTVANPDVRLDALEIPDWEADGSPLSPAVASTPDVAQAPRKPEAPAAPPIALAVKTTSYQVKRRDSWRKIAESTVGDADRAVELRALNIGREVEAGLVLTAEMPLKSGWAVEVPIS